MRAAIKREEPTPSKAQVKAMRRIKSAYEQGDGQVTLGGLAGTGKTFIASHLQAYMGWSEVTYLAPTNFAANVLSGKLRAAGVETLPTTIHRAIYHPSNVHCDRCPGRWNVGEACHGKGSCGCALVFEPKPPTMIGEAIIVDESSMVGLDVYRDILAAWPGVFKVFIGDHGQLGPVRSNFNLMEIPDVKLEKIHRQVKGSPILKLAMKARTGDRLPLGIIGGNSTSGGTTRDHPTGLPLGWSEDIRILCHRNAVRVALNKKIRSRRGLVGNPQPGDQVICFTNDRKRGLYNGMRGEVVKCRSRDERTFDLWVDIDDAGERYQGVALKRQFNSIGRLGAEWGVDLWDFGYAQTVHTAQGSESRGIVLIEEPRAIGHMTAPEYRRWLYTGITRAQSDLTILVYPHGYPAK